MIVMRTPGERIKSSRRSLPASLAAAAAICLFMPGDAWSYVPQEYPALYTHQISRFVFLFSLVVVLFALRGHRLYRRPGWRQIYLSVFVFILWDLLVIAGRFGSLWVIGELDGWEYFKRIVVAEGRDYFFYLAACDQILLDVAMGLFYYGLRTHLKEVREEPETHGTALVFLPFLPIIISDMAGNLVFIILAGLSLATSYRLYFRDRDNPVWSYMVWLCWADFIYSLSRSIGHISRHILIATGNNDLWEAIQPWSGSMNTVALLGIGVVSLFFVRAYQIYLKMDADRRQIRKINNDLTELNEGLETLVAERTMALMALTVADKIRNPAFVVGSACRRLLEKEQVPGKAGETVRDMMDECRKLESIVSQFENLFRSKKGTFRYEDLGAVIRSVVDGMEQEARDRHITLRVVLPADELRINMQKNLMKTALYHLMRNALEATPEDGRVTVRGEQVDGYVSVVISDTGKGIPAESLDQTFEPFYSTKEHRFGMGLPLVRQIVIEHLGEITISSEHGNGTSVRLCFPVRWEEQKNSPPGPA